MSKFLKISIPCPIELQDILIAELSIANFDSFQEIGGGIEAFIDEHHFDKTLLVDVLKKYHLNSDFNWELQKDVNWNEQWEKNFDPVYIENHVQIRATFHNKENGFVHDIIINPKMSFGTGHHETTYLTVSEQLVVNHKNKTVLDVGTGTGVLSIMAHQLGASSIIATDIDDWSIENCRENFELNQVKNFKLFKGKIDNLTLPGNQDIILANINKNILLEELPMYSNLLSKDGVLLLSGFYSEDIEDLKEKAKQSKLVFQHSKIKNNWAMLSFSHSHA